MSTNKPADATNQDILTALQLLQTDVDAIKNAPVAEYGAVNILSGTLGRSIEFTLPSEGFYRVVCASTVRSVDLFCVGSSVASVTAIPIVVFAVGDAEYSRRIRKTSTLRVSFDYAVDGIFKI